MIDEKQLRVLSVSMSLPTDKRPRDGVFVHRRLAALSKTVDLRVVRPMPWFPILSRSESPARPPDYRVDGRRMLYIPGILKHLDAWWMKRALEPLVAGMHRQRALDVIDAHFGYPTGVACCQIARQLGIAAFVTLRGVEAKQLKSRRIGPDLIEHLENCTGVIAVSHSLRDAAVQSGINGDKIRVIPNAVNARLFSPGDQRESRSLLGLPASVPIIISVGSWIERKGHLHVLTALSKLRQSVPDALLLLVGGPVRHDACFPRRLRAMIDRLGLRRAVRLIGPVHPDEVPIWLRAADAFVLASLHEGCCNALLEAMACGLPVVVTPAGDNDRYVIPGENGYVVPFGDVTQIARRLVQVLRNPWDPLKIAGRVRDYSWQSVANSVRAFMVERLTVHQNTDSTAPRVGRALSSDTVLSRRMAIGDGR